MAETRRYRTIVADPPWDYGRDHERWATAPGGVMSHVKMPYRPMTVEAICALPVRTLADTDARCFLWTTNRYLREGFDVLAAWGFVYRQTLVWRKTGNPSPFGGSVAPVHGEFLLVGCIGSPAVRDRLPSSVLDAPAAAVPGSHSAKPECWLDYIETCSLGPYLELFARRARFGWDYWGDQSLGTAQMPGEAA